MVKKTLETLRRNPVLILLFLTYMLVMYLSMYFLMPHQLDRSDIVQMMIETLKMLVISLAAAALGLVFFAGYGHMTAEAVTTGKTTIRSFPAGIKRFFVRLLLAALLLMAMGIGLSIVLGIASIPLSILMVLGNQGDPAAAASKAGMILSAFVFLLVTAVVPFIILWFPAIFMDDAGVIKSLKRGMKAGVGNYGLLLLWTFILYIPVIIHTMVNFQSYQAGITMTPGYLLVMIVMSIFALLYFPLIFLAYGRWKEQGKNRQKNV